MFPIFFLLATYPLLVLFLLYQPVEEHLVSKGDSKIAELQEKLKVNDKKLVGECVKGDSISAVIGSQETEDGQIMTDVKVRMKKAGVTVTRPLQAATKGLAMNRKEKLERRVKVFACSSCGVSFLTAGAFLSHRVKEHSEEEEEYSSSATSSTSFHTAIGTSREELQ